MPTIDNLHLITRFLEITWGVFLLFGIPALTITMITLFILSHRRRTRRIPKGEFFLYANQEGLQDVKTRGRATLSEGFFLEKEVSWGGIFQTLDSDNRELNIGIVITHSLTAATREELLEAHETNGSAENGLRAVFQTRLKSVNPMALCGKCLELKAEIAEEFSARFLHTKVNQVQIIQTYLA